LLFLLLLFFLCFFSLALVINRELAENVREFRLVDSSQLEAFVDRHVLDFNLLSIRKLGCFVAIRFFVLGHQILEHFLLLDFLDFLLVLLLTVALFLLLEN